MLQPGQVIDQRYEVVRQVGKGAMATVYEVRHRGLHSRHALKVLNADLATDPDLRNRFLAEGRIQAQLSHPNIVAVTDIVTDPVPGLVMEMLDGVALDEHLRAHGVPSEPVKILELFVPILDAVGAAHGAGVVHRDLKPENILVGAHAKGGLLVKVADFGIAKVLDRASLSTGKKKTEAGMRMGTVLYMSPEQIRGAADLDARSDIFALGAILYEIATGRIAFDAPSEYDTMSNIVAGTYVAPERVVGGLHPGLAACIRKALAVDPAERFADCAAFRGAVETAVHGGGSLPPRPSRSLAVTHPNQPVIAATGAPSSPPAAAVPAFGPPGSPSRTPAAPGTSPYGSRPVSSPPGAPGYGAALPAHAPPPARYPVQGRGAPAPYAHGGYRPAAVHKDPSTAALLEALPGFFIHIFGCGHLYNGNVGLGLGLMFGYWLIQLINVVLAFFIVGFITFPLTWILFMVLSATKASKDARFINEYGSSI